MKVSQLSSQFLKYATLQVGQGFYKSVFEKMDLVPGDMMSCNDFWSYWLDFLESEDGMAFLHSFDGSFDRQEEKLLTEVNDTAEEKEDDAWKVCLTLTYIFLVSRRHMIARIERHIHARISARTSKRHRKQGLE